MIIVALLALIASSVKADGLTIGSVKMNVGTQ